MSVILQDKIDVPRDRSHRVYDDLLKQTKLPKPPLYCLFVCEVRPHFRDPALPALIQWVFAINVYLICTKTKQFDVLKGYMPDWFKT